MQVGFGIVLCSSREHRRVQNACLQGGRVVRSPAKVSHRRRIRPNADIGTRDRLRWLEIIYPIDLGFEYTLWAMTDDNGVPAQGFLSYVRLDNEDYLGVADELKKSLEGRFHAATGRKLQIFVDRENIGWGDDWRGRIRESVQAATFFIPVVTMRYFESEACREELVAFYKYAEELGVTGLILPIVIDGADQIRADDPRDDVQLIERLNYKNVNAAWVEGYGSPEWLKAIAGMVNELKVKLADAESRLAEREAESVDEATAGSEGSGDDEMNEEEEADVLALGADFENLTASTKEVQTSFEHFTGATSAMSGVDFSSGTFQQRQSRLVSVAQALKGPAEEVYVAGSDFEKNVLQTDVRLRAIAEALRSIDAEQAEEQLQKLVAGFKPTPEMLSVVPQLDELVQAMKMAALTNVSIRKAVKPAIAGLQSINNALDTVNSWQNI